MRKRRIEDSLTEHYQIIMPQHINGTDRLFGGMLLMWIDMVAGIVARRHCEGNVITASIDNLQFKEGAKLNDIVVLIGKVTYVGNSSMEVRVDTYIEDKDGTRRPINRAYLVMVGLDEEEKPTPVPKLVIETEMQKAEWDGGRKRNQLRKLRRESGF